MFRESNTHISPTFKLLTHDDNKGIINPMQQRPHRKISPEDAANIRRIYAAMEGIKHWQNVGKEAQERTIANLEKTIQNIDEATRLTQQRYGLDDTKSGDLNADADIPKAMTELVQKRELQRKITESMRRYSDQEIDYGDSSVPLDPPQSIFRRKPSLGSPPPPHSYNLADPTPETAIETIPTTRDPQAEVKLRKRMFVSATIFLTAMLCILWGIINGVAQ